MTGDRRGGAVGRRAVRHRPRRLERARWVTRIDLLHLAFLLGAAPFATLSPRPVARVILAGLERVYMLARRGATRRRLAAPVRMLGDDAGERVGEIADHRLRTRAEIEWGRVRNLRTRGWSPRTTLEGEEHLRDALARGRGVILWRMDFAESLVLHRACWDHGYPLVQLSDATHGSEYSRLGVRMLAPLIQRGENAYLERRIVIPLDRSLAYLREVIGALEAGHIVVISGELTSRQTVELPFFGRRRVFATGAPGLAHRTGAALIPQSARRVGREDYVVTFHPEVDVDRSLPRAEYIDRAVESYARSVEQAVRRSPGDWGGWWFGYTTELGEA